MDRFEDEKFVKLLKWESHFKMLWSFAIYAKSTKPPPHISAGSRKTSRKTPNLEDR
jgi:hypothetical protein